MVKEYILATIGDTPMVRINRLCPNQKVNIFAKREGRLRKGQTIIEPTSGNTGIGLAITGIVKGYPVEIVMSSAVSIERRKIIRSYGAKVILTPAEEGTDGAIRLARKLVAEKIVSIKKRIKENSRLRCLGIGSFLFLLNAGRNPQAGCMGI